MLLAAERERHRGVVRGACGAFEHDPLVAELVHVVALGHTLGHVDLLGEARTHASGGMQCKVVAKLAGVGAEAVAAKEERREKGAAGDDGDVALDAQAGARSRLRLYRAYSTLRDVQTPGTTFRIRDRARIPPARHLPQGHVQPWSRPAGKTADPRSHA